MKPLRTLALTSASAVLIMGQAVAAFAHPQHEPSAVSLPARLARPQPNTTASPSPRRPAIRSWPILPESPASPSRRWAPWECTTSRVIW